MDVSEMVFKFIQDVEKFGELYDKGNKHFNHTARKESIWNGLSAKYKINAKVKWTYLRERYSREKKKAARLGESYKSTWHLYPCLYFLDSHVKQRDRRSTKWNFQPPVKLLINNVKTPQIENQTDKEIEELFSPYVLEEECKEKKSAFPWSDDESNSAEATNDSLNYTQNENSIHKEELSKEEIPLTEFLDFNDSRKRKFPKEVNPTLNQSRTDILDEVPQKIANEFSDNDDNEDWHFLQSLKYKMRKMRDEEKTQFKIEMLLQAEKAVLNSKKNY